MKRRGRPPYPDVLTPREWEVLEFLRQGLSNEEIAERLGITLRTAKFHVSEILSKLGVETREQAAAWSPAERAPAQRWLAWPLAARIAGALVVAAAVAGLGLLAWGVLRTSGEGEQEPLPSDPEGLVNAALERMEALDSYQLDVVDSAVEGSATLEVVRGGLVAVRTTLVTPSDIEGQWVKESIYETTGWYDRLCQDYPVACGPWLENRSKYPSSPMGVPILETVPSADWPLIVLEYARDLRVLPPDSARPDLVGIAGTVELYAALGETLRRHVPPEEAGDPLSTNRGPEVAAVQVTMSRDDAAVDEIVVELTESPLSSRKTIRFHYSHFNEISVTPPAEFVPMPEVPSPTP